MPFWNWRTYPNHTGLDWAQPLGTPIPAIADGIITFSDQWGPRAAGTKTLTMPQYGGLKWMMCHLDEPIRGLPVGTRVKTGDIICYVGNSGNSTGPHLHGELWLNGVSLYEQDYFDLTNWIGKNGTPAGDGGDSSYTPPITAETLLEEDMILIAQRKNANLAKGRYNPTNGRIREITKHENALLRAGEKASQGNIVYATVSDASYKALLTGAK
jgi:murein DD-endopeptidase MepM/ murein hydrolase activator NlpD